MSEYSRFIVEAMAYVEREILSINPHSINRFRLYNTIHRIIVANVFRIKTPDPEKNQALISYIFKTQLVNELSITMKEKLQ